MHTCVCACTVQPHLCSPMWWTYRAYTPGPPFPRNCCALTSGPVNCSHTQTHTHQRLHTYTRKRQIENAASCILFEPCWQFSWQSAKVGAAQTTAVQGKSESANWMAWGVYFQWRHLDLTRWVFRYWETHICVSRARTCVCISTHVHEPMVTVLL